LNGGPDILENIRLHVRNVQGALRILKHGEQADHDYGEQRDSDHHFQECQGTLSAVAG
jgi:hypothetical protein